MDCSSVVYVARDDMRSRRDSPSCGEVERRTVTTTLTERPPLGGYGVGVGVADRGGRTSPLLNLSVE